MSTMIERETLALMSEEESDDFICELECKQPKEYEELLQRARSELTNEMLNEMDKFFGRSLPIKRWIDIRRKELEDRKMREKLKAEHRVKIHQ
jgi:hypothetical protein